MSLLVSGRHPAEAALVELGDQAIRQAFGVLPQASGPQPGPEDLHGVTPSLTLFRPLPDENIAGRCSKADADRNPWRDVARDGADGSAGSDPETRRENDDRTLRPCVPDVLLIHCMFPLVSLAARRGHPAGAVVEGRCARLGDASDERWTRMVTHRHSRRYARAAERAASRGVPNGGRLPVQCRMSGNRCHRPETGTKWMAGGSSKDGAVQDQVDASLEDGVRRCAACQVTLDGKAPRRQFPARVRQAARTTRTPAALPSSNP